jgi:tRNA uridine 5-carboxymethylaminomethyl modification enzyme
MIDDLINKGTFEPYRLLSSRAEYRLLMRHDNADIRLRKHGYRIGLVSEEKYNEFLNKVELIQKNKEILEKTILSGSQKMIEEIKSLGIDDFKGGVSVANLLKRPGVRYEQVKKYAPVIDGLDQTGIEQLEIAIRYEGYIEKEKKEAARMAKLEEVKIPRGLDYLNMDGLALEARSKLQEVDPLTIGQASRISGVNPADIAQLLMHIKRGGNNE